MTKAAVIGRLVASAAKVAATSRASTLIFPSWKASIVRCKGGIVLKMIEIAITGKEGIPDRHTRRVEVATAAPPQRNFVCTSQLLRQSAGSVFARTERIRPSFTF